MELIGIIGNGRLERELRRREAALREAAGGSEAPEPQPGWLGTLREAVGILEGTEPAPDWLASLREAVEAPQAAEEPEPLIAQYASTSRGQRSCEFCGRGFHGYGQFLNHNCHKTDQVDA